jgi:hypothetical protein
MAGTMVARGCMVVVGGLLVLGGLAVVALGYPLVALSMVAGGVVLVIAAVFEVMRYRSAAGGKPGPGGGELGLPEARFKPTDEVFVDPTTNKRMRVYADDRTGERRYVAEG